jgi:hypothetical protein
VTDTRIGSLMVGKGQWVPFLLTLIERSVSALTGNAVTDNGRAARSLREYWVQRIWPET